MTYTSFLTLCTSDVLFICATVNTLLPGTKYDELIYQFVFRVPVVSFAAVLSTFRYTLHLPPAGRMVRNRSEEGSWE